MKVALYARVSTDDQEPANQLEPLRADAARRGWTVGKVYVDRGWSGANKERPALSKLLKDAAGETKPFDAVIVWKLDRMARSIFDLANITKALEDKGIGFLSVTEGFDLTTAHGKLLRTILGGFAEFERDLIVERTKAGMERARRAGKHIGRPKKLQTKTN